MEYDKPAINTAEVPPVTKHKPATARPNPAIPRDREIICFRRFF